MGQDFVGSNNINLMQLDSLDHEFGGKILLNLGIFAKIPDLIPAIFNAEDNNILEYVDDDGFPVEPYFYVPIIPMILVNGGEGMNRLGTIFFI